MLLGVSVTTRKTHRKYISSTRSRSFFFLHLFMIIMTMMMIIMMMMMMIMMMSARVADIIRAIDVDDL